MASRSDPRFSVAHLTAIGLPPAELVRAACRTGYGTVGLRLIAVSADSPGYPLMHDRAAMRATKAAMAETGVGVLDIEFVKITPELDVPGLEAFVAVGAELGARHVITAPYDPDLGRVADRLGEIGALCGRYGMGAVLEYFPWTEVPTLAAAAAVVEAAGRDEVGVLVDVLHFARGGSDGGMFAGIPASRFPFVHVCDAPGTPRDGRGWTREELLHAARVERLPPGEGDIDIAGILRHLPAGIPVVLEVPMTAMAAVHGEEAVMRRVREAAGRLLGT